MDAQELLKAENHSAAVFDMYSIKPINKMQILMAADKYKCLVTVEEHNIVGGLGSAIAEVLAEAGVAVPLLRIGLNDAFAVGYGTQKEVRQMNGLDAEEIARQICNRLA
jgi:transketolase